MEGTLYKTWRAAAAAVLLLLAAVFLAPHAHAAGSDSYYYPNYDVNTGGYVDLMRYMQAITVTVNGQKYTQSDLQTMKNNGSPLTLHIGDTMNVNFTFSLCGRAYDANDKTQLDEANSYKVTYTNGTTYLNGDSVAVGATGILDDTSLMQMNTTAAGSFLRLDVSWLKELAPSGWSVSYTDGSVSFQERDNYLYVYFPGGANSQTYANPGWFSIGLTLGKATDSIHIPATDGYYVPGQDAWDMPITVTTAQTTAAGEITTYGDIKVKKIWNTNGESHPDAKIVLYYTEDGQAKTAVRTLSGDTATGTFTIRQGMTDCRIEEDMTGLDQYTSRMEVSQDGKTYTFTNTAGKDVSFSKRTLTGTDELPGAKLSLYCNDALVDQWTSGTEPHTVRLYAGPFRLHEEYAPAGYAVSTDIEFQVQDDLTLKLKSSVGKLDGDTIVITDQPLNVKLAKTDENGKPLAGAVLTLTDKTAGEEVDRWTSTDTAHEITYQTDSGHVLVAGHTYVLHEESAPSGYTLAADVEFVFNGDGTIPNCGYHTVTMQDQPTATPTPAAPTPTPTGPAATPTSPNPQGPGTPEKQQPGRVQTGDSLLPWLWLALGIACLVGAAAVGLHYYRRSQIPAYWRLGMRNE